MSKIETEYTVASRRRAEGANKAYRALSEISDADVELVKAIVPEILVVKTYTEQDLVANLNGEVETVRRVADDLRNYIEHRLAFYEEQL